MAHNMQEGDRLIHTVLKLHEITPAKELSQDEDALIKRAFEKWNKAEEFDDDDVERVKVLFRSVFAVQCRFVGCTADDALLMGEISDDDLTRIYAVQVKETGELRWVRWETRDEWKCLLKIPLDHIIRLLGLSEIAQLQREERGDV